MEVALVESYIGGLKEEIRSEIKLFWPTSLLHAISLASLLEYKLQKFKQPPQLSVEIEIQVPKDAKEKKGLLENEKKEDTKLDEVDKTETMVFSAATVVDKYASFTSLISPIDFVIPELFNDVVKHQTCLFVVLPNLKQVASAKILILRHFETQSRVFSNNRMDS